MKHLDQVVEEFKKENPNFQDQIEEKVCLLQKKMETEVPELKEQRNVIIRNYNKHFDHLCDIHIIASLGTIIAGISTAVAGILNYDISLIIGGFATSVLGPIVERKIVISVGKFYEDKYNINQPLEKLTNQIDQIESQYTLYNIFKKIFQLQPLTDHEIIVLRKIKEKEVSYDYKTLVFIQQYLSILNERKQRQQDLVQKIYQLEPTQHYDQILDCLEDTVKEKRLTLK